MCAMCLFFFFTPIAYSCDGHCCWSKGRAWHHGDHETTAVLRCSETTISLSNTSAGLPTMTHCRLHGCCWNTHLWPPCVCSSVLSLNAQDFFHADRIASYCEDEYILQSQPWGGDPIEWCDPRVDTLSLTLCVFLSGKMYYTHALEHILVMLCFYKCCFFAILVVFLFCLIPSLHFSGNILSTSSKHSWFSAVMRRSDPSCSCIAVVITPDWPGGVLLCIS